MGEPGNTDDDWYSGGVFVKTLLLPDAVMAGHFAMVAQVDDDGVVSHRGAVHYLQESANQVICE
jgi:hypothetical protein